MIRSISIAFALLFATSIMAQTPQMFNYQGVARDLSGDPMTNQDISIRASIVQSSVSGPEVYSETHNTSTNELGLFTLQIGEGTVESGVFSDISWGSDNHFLKIEMDVNGGTNYELIGVSKLASVPYALYAENGSPWQESAGSIYYQGGNVGIQLSEPQSNLEVASDFRVSSPFNRDRGYTIQSGGGQSIHATNDLITTVDRSAEYRIGISNENTNFAIKNGVGQTLFIARAVTQNVGVGVQLGENVKSKFQVRGGDIYIEDVDSGVIMKSPDGQCWRMTVSNLGQPVFNAITCP